MPWPRARWPEASRVEVESVGVGEAVRVAVGGGRGHPDRLAGGDGDPADGHVLDGEAPDGEQGGAFVAQELLDRGGQLRQVLAQGGQLLGVLQQSEHGVADELHRVLVTGEEDEEGEGHQFVLAEPVALVTHGDQVGEQVVGGRRSRLSARSLVK